jgi:glycosyltransferase involved in cell wall biosynthesis
MNPRPDAPGDQPIGLSILVPVYNEARTIRQVLDRISRVSFPTRTEIVIVDDGSTDGTVQLLRELPSSPHVQAVFHERNQGKGRAIRTALEHARGEIVVVQDADEELNPEDLRPLYEIVSGSPGAVCYGSRFAGDVRSFHGQPTYWANRLLNAFCNLVNGLRLTDMNTCYKMMPADVARRLDITSRGFAMEPEITTKLARMGLTIVEHPITYRPRSKAEGKKIRFADFFRYLAAIIRFRFARMSPPYR